MRSARRMKLNLWNSSARLTDAFPKVLESNYVPGIAAPVTLRLRGFFLLIEDNGALKYELAGAFPVGI